MEKFLRSQHWIKILTRDIPFLRLVIVYESYSQRFKKDVGLNYPTGISILEKGVFNIYRSKKGIVDFGNDFLTLKNKKKFFKNILKKMGKLKKEAEGCINFSKSKLKPKDNLNQKELLKLFEKIYKCLKNFWSLQWLPMALEFSLNYINRGDVIRRYEKYLVGIKEKTQYKTVELENLLDDALKKIAKIKKLEGGLISFATPKEVISNEISKKKLIERKKISILGAAKNKCIVFSGKRARELVKNIPFLEEKTVTANLIQGAPAYNGKVEGRVKVIFFREDLKNLRKGEIIVTPMTEAFYTPYLKRVAAIITDEGGITCHAAIISREMKIPCVIGTKIATKVLKDGDLVEVDANRGIVKKCN